MSKPDRSDPDDHRPPDPAGVVRPLTIEGFPSGYRYGVTRYADLILRDAFPSRCQQLTETLSEFRIDVSELLTGGGSRASMTRRFDQSLNDRGWGKRSISISKSIDGQLIHDTRGHEIDMFAPGEESSGYPGIAIEMEWNNKDPFFDRDLLNFMALHREGALAVGVIITRGPELQRYVGKVIKTNEKETSKKYGQSTTHWNKLVPRVALGGGGECPLFLIGIEPERIDGFSRIADAYDKGIELWR